MFRPIAAAILIGNLVLIILMTPIGGDDREPVRVLDRATEAVTSVVSRWSGGRVLARSRGTAGSANRNSWRGEAFRNEYRAGDDAGDFAYDTYTESYAYVGQGRRGQNDYYAEPGGAEWQPDRKQARDDGHGWDEDTPDSAEEPPEALLARNQAISGRVMDRQGMPLAGIGLVASAMRLFDLPPGIPIPAEDTFRQALSDAGGRYGFGQLAAGEYRIRALPSGNYAEAQLAARTGVDFADIVLTGEKEVFVSGNVSSTHGEPLAGVLVMPKVLGAGGGYTDEYGDYRLQMALKHDTGFAILASREGFRESMTLVPRSKISNGGINVDLRLEPVSELTQVSGTVTGADGTRLAGKSVRLYSTSARQKYRASTDLEGQFFIPGVATGEDYQLRIDADQYYREYLLPNIAVPADGANLSIALQAMETGTLSGQMANANGETVSNFRLELRTKSSSSGGVPVIADSGGRFFTAAAPTGQLVLETRAAPRLVVDGIEMAPGAEVSQQLILDWGHNELRGMIVDGQGNPVAASNVSLTWTHAANGVLSRSIRQTAADAQGYFLFSQLGPGTHVILVNAPGFKQARIHHDVSMNGSDVVVKLENNNVG